MKKELTRSELRELKIKRNKVRRQRQLRRRIVVVLTIIIMSIFSTLGFTSFFSKAQEKTDEPVKAKCYTSVMIEYGSSLSSIASEYCDDDYYESRDSYIKEVMFINHMTDTSIKAGNYIIVPYYIEVNS